MDGSQFDLLARGIAASFSSRRATLGGLAGGILAAFGLARDERNGAAKNKKKKGKGKGKNKDKKKKCPDGRNRCGNTCCKAEETCKRGKCVHHCEDGQKNFGETDIDCGHVCDLVLGNVPISRCDLRQQCNEDRDCKLDQFCREPQPGAGKQCVECLIDTHCGGGRCLDNFCFSCAIDADCPRPNDPPEFEFCVELAGVCPNNQPCTCRECREDSHCPAARPHCQGECFECLEDDHCPPGQLCDERGRCEGFQCDSDSDCTQPGRRVCLNGACVGCADDGDCVDQQICNASHTCEPGLRCLDGTTICTVGSSVCACRSCAGGSHACGCCSFGQNCEAPPCD